MPKLLSEEILTEMTKRQKELPPALQKENLKGLCLISFAQVLSWVKRIQTLEQEKGK